MAKMFIYDVDGNITETKVKGRGRPPTGSTVDDNGDMHVHPVATTQVQYVTIGLDGSVTREDKKRGRTRRGYELMAEGEYAGHYVMQETEVVVEETVAETTENEATAEVTEPAEVAKAAK